MNTKARSVKFSEKVKNVTIKTNHDLIKAWWDRKSGSTKTSDKTVDETYQAAVTLIVAYMAKYGS